MKRNRSRLLLRRLFKFRLFSLLASLIVLYLRINYDLFNSFDKEGWVIGVIGSALVWSTVELVDFFVKTYEQYSKERVRFWIMVEAYFSKVEDVIREDIENISWKAVYDLIKKLQSDAAKFPFENGIYTCSKEFYGSYYYIENLMYKLLGCFAIAKLDERGEIPLNSESDRWLKDSFLLITKENVKDGNLRELFVEWEGLKKNLHDLAEMELKFEKQDIAYQYMSSGCKGRLKNVTDFNNIRTLVTLKPHYVLEKNMLKEQKHSNWDICYTVIELMYYDGYFDEFLQRKITNNELRNTYEDYLK